MRRHRFRFSDFVPLVLAVCWSSRAYAQACCAGGSAVTPGRLEPHEVALVGTELHAASVIGSYQIGAYRASPPGTPEYDFEEDVFGAVRFLRRAQVALLVPIDETYRRTPADGGHFGGGIGDVNASARYDFVLAGQSVYVPELLSWRASRSRRAGRRSRRLSRSRWTRRASVPSRSMRRSRSSRRSPMARQRHGDRRQADRARRRDSGHAVHVPGGGRLHLRERHGGRSPRRSPSRVIERSTAQTLKGARSSVTVLTASGLWPIGDSYRLLGGVFRRFAGRGPRAATSPPQIGAHHHGDPLMDVKPRVVARWVGYLCWSACVGGTLLGACSTGVPASPRFEPADPDALPLPDVAVAVACPDAGYPSCPSPAPSWKTQVQPIVDTSCSPCHFNGGTGTGNGSTTRPPQDFDTA